MKVVLARPPMFAEIDAVFDVAGKPVIFCWGDSIYNPERIVVSPELLVHEKVHSARQAVLPTGPEGWWARYLVEELPAHRAEYFRYAARHSNPKARRHYLSGVASRLASTLYGGLIAPADAQRAILRGWL